MRYWDLALLVAAGLALASCGESDEEKALNQVCDARADIQKQVNELSSLTLSTATVDGIKGNLSAIENDLKEIKDAEGNLNDQRKQEVQAANQAFSAAGSGGRQRSRHEHLDQRRAVEASVVAAATRSELQADVRADRLQLVDPKRPVTNRPERSLK